MLNALTRFVPFPTGYFVAKAVHLSSITVILVILRQDTEIIGSIAAFRVTARPGVHIKKYGGK
jgi:hypothetical protein